MADEAPAPSVEELKQRVNQLLHLLRAVYGPRSTAIIMVGIPIGDSEHDRFSAGHYGPCLSARGLLAWGEREILGLIDAGDTSKNGKPHP